MAEWEGFAIEGRLGVGTTGTVWLARQLSVGRPVALKELAPELAHDAAVRARLRAEAQVLARLGTVYVLLSMAQGGTWKPADRGADYPDGAAPPSLKQLACNTN